MGIDPSSPLGQTNQLIQELEKMKQNRGITNDAAQCGDRRGGIQDINSLIPSNALRRPGGNGRNVGIGVDPVNMNTGREKDRIMADSALITPPPLRLVTSGKGFD